MSIRSALPIAVTAVLLSACATRQLEPAIPDAYSGSTAKVADSLMNSDERQGVFCVLAAIDGRFISNSIDETQARQSRRGINFLPWVTNRRVPALPMKATLRCEVVYGGSGILGLNGLNRAGETVVDFSPRVDGRYVVKGTLSRTTVTAWIEEAESGSPATSTGTGPVK